MTNTSESWGFSLRDCEPEWVSSSSYQALSFCIHLDSDLSKLIGYDVSSVGGKSVKQSHVKGSIQKTVIDQGFTFYVTPEKKGGGGTSCRFPSAGV